MTWLNVLALSPMLALLCLMLYAARDSQGARDQLEAQLREKREHARARRMAQDRARQIEERKQRAALLMVARRLDRVTQRLSTIEEIYAEAEKSRDRC